MLMVVRGDRVHLWTYCGKLDNQERPVDLMCQGKILTRAGSDYGYKLAKGRYLIHKEWVPHLRCDWFMLDGCPVGASCGSVLQWTGNAWRNREIAIFDRGEKILPSCADDNYTLELQTKLIANGDIFDKLAIDGHNRLRSKWTDMAILRGVRQLIKSHNIGKIFKCFIRWASWEVDVNNGFTDLCGCYRIDLRHCLPSGAGQMFAGVRVEDGRLVVDHCRERVNNRRFIVDYKTLDSGWPTFDLIDPNCFDSLLAYLQEAYAAGSDQGLKRYVRQRSVFRVS